MASRDEGTVMTVVEGATVQVAIASHDHTCVVVLEIEEAVALLESLRGACVEAWANRLRLASPAGSTANDD